MEPKDQILLRYKDYKAKVLLTPSLLSSESDVKNLTQILRKNETLLKDYDFYYPYSFEEILEKSEEDNNKRDIIALNDFYKINDIGDALNIVKLLKNPRSVINSFYLDKLSLMWGSFKHQGFYFYLKETISNDIVRELVFDSYYFLHEYSIVVDKSKEVFDLFKKYGNIVIDFGSRTMNKLYKKILKLPDDAVLKRIQKLQALGKFIAVGMSPFLAMLLGPLGLALDAGIGLFLLMDP